MAKIVRTTEFAKERTDSLAYFAISLYYLFRAFAKYAKGNLFPHANLLPLPLLAHVLRELRERNSHIFHREQSVRTSDNAAHVMSEAC